MHLSFRCAAQKTALAALAVLGYASVISHGLAAEEWPAVAPEDLAATVSRLDADAPAEILMWKLEIDDKAFPKSRRREEFIRYKIFKPDNVEEITRMSRQNVGGFHGGAGKVELRARLLLPDGTIKVFGEESIRERVLVQRGQIQRSHAGDVGFVRAEVKEKFLAITGVEPGAILEFDLKETDIDPDEEFTQELQRPRIPIRHVEYVHRYSDHIDYDRAVFAFNLVNAKFDEDKRKKIVTVTGKNVPALVEEPFSGAELDRTLAVFFCYTYLRQVVFGAGDQGSQVFTDKAGPWAPYSSINHAMQTARTEPTRRVKELAAQLCEGAASDLEKARRIHNHVQTLHQRFLKLPRGEFEHTTFRDRHKGLDDILDYEKSKDYYARSRDFLWLALGLYRSAGLEARLALLPDRKFRQFDPKLISRAFLEDYCAAIRIDGQWMFSLPYRAAVLPFGMLPWQHEGQVALLAGTNRQDFIPVPLTPAEQSVVNNIGVFRLDSDGNATGECLARFTGHAAAELRAELKDETREKQEAMLKEKLNRHLKAAEFKIVRLTGEEEADAPLDVVYAVELPGFATVMRDRLLVRPSVFRAQAPAPFSATRRVNRVFFPYGVTESDRVIIQLPPGYEPEAKAAPASYPQPTLSYTVALGFDRTKNALQLKRDFVSNVISVPADSYGDLRTWYNAVANSDQHELVFLRTASAATTPAPSQP